MFPPQSPAKPLPTTPAFLHSLGWFRTVLLSVDIAGSLGSLAAVGGSIPPLHEPEDRLGGIENPRGWAAAARRGAATSHGALSGTGLRTRPQAAETDEAAGEAAL